MAIWRIPCAVVRIRDTEPGCKNVKCSIQRGKSGLPVLGGDHSGDIWAGSTSNFIAQLDAAATTELATKLQNSLTINFTIVAADSRELLIII